MSPERLRLPAPVRSVRLHAQTAGDPSQAVLSLVRERALAEGAAAARQAMREEAVTLLEESVAQVTASASEARDSLARTAVELGVEIARRLLRAEITRGNYDLQTLVRESLAEAVAGRGPCVIHLHPDDCDALRDVKFRTGTRVQADEGVRRGDVHVETELGLLVRENAGALDAIEKRLMEDLH